METSQPATLAFNELSRTSWNLTHDITLILKIIKTMLLQKTVFTLNISGNYLNIFFKKSIINKI